MSILDTLGISKDSYDKAEGKAATEAFKPLPSGAYPGTIESVIVYTGKFGTQMSYKVRLNDSDRVVSFANDIGKTLQTGAENGGFASRLKSFVHASGVSESDLTMKEGVKINSYGTEYEGSELIGWVGKPVIALVKLVENPNVDEKDAYRFQNEIEGVTAPDGTDATGTNAKEVFEAKITERPVFLKRLKAKKTVTPSVGTDATTASTGAPAGMTPPKF